MKNKKVIAIAMSIGIFTSSFSGVYVSYAKNEATQSDRSNKKANESTENSTSLAPTPVITELEAELYNQKILTNSKAPINAGGGSEVIYKGTKRVLASNNPQAGDVYNIGAEDIDELLSQGYSIQDIFKADEIGNEILEEPKILLERKKTSDKSLEEVKDDILKERNDKSINYLKDKYEKEYKKLSDKKFKNDEILSLLAYLDINKMQLTDDLIKEYKNNGEELLKKEVKHQLSQETKKKYQISEKDANVLSENSIKQMENISRDTNIPVKDLIKSHLKALN